MGKKFDAIFESVVSRYQIGGYLPGDIIKFRPNYKSVECYNSMSSVMKKELDDMINSGLNIRVVQVGDKLSGASAGNQFKTADQAVITVAADQGGGRYFTSITVPPSMIDLVDQSDPTPKVPDQFEKKYGFSLKPEVYTPDTKHITRLTDKGNGKATPTQISESTQVSRDNASMIEVMQNL